VLPECQGERKECERHQLLVEISANTAFSGFSGQSTQLIQYLCTSVTMFNGNNKVVSELQFMSADGIKTSE
jgi:hypothetical protein